MFNRRSFLKSLTAAMLPSGPIFACSGMGPYDPPQTVPLKPPPFKNQLLSEYITQYLGHTHWAMDDEQRIGAKLGAIRRGNAKNSQDYFTDDFPNITLDVFLPDEHEGFVCTAIDLLVEEHLLFDDRLKKVAETDVYLARIKSAYWQFPIPNVIKSVSFRGVHFSAPGRIICITKLDDITGVKPAKILVTTTLKLVGNCHLDRIVVPSYDYAIATCERLRQESWSSHITKADIESYVSKCKAKIRFD